jgi:hypothetical protein
VIVAALLLLLVGTSLAMASYVEKEYSMYSHGIFKRIFDRKGEFS